MSVYFSVGQSGLISRVLFARVQTNTHHTRTGRRGGRGSRGRHRQYWIILSTTANPQAPRPLVDIKRTSSLAWDAATSNGGRRDKLLDSVNRNNRNIRLTNHCQLHQNSYSIFYNCRNCSNSIACNGIKFKKIQINSIQGSQLR